MYGGQKEKSLATPTDDQASVNTPEASSGTASNSIIAQQTNGSNPSGEKNSTQHNAARSVDSDGNELSEAQQEYFKDSKVRDNDGNLLVMWHASNADNITVFQSGGSAGLIYFADDPQNAKKASRGKKHLYSVYLNAINPVSGYRLNSARHKI